MSAPVTRRAVIDALGRTWVAAAVALLTGGLSPRPAHARARRHFCRRAGPGPHPVPRPGIDASHMPAAQAVREHPHAVAAFGEGRTIPEILDGIRCQCGCANEAGMRSLLTC